MTEGATRPVPRRRVFAQATALRCEFCGGEFVQMISPSEKPRFYCRPSCYHAAQRAGGLVIFWQRVIKTPGCWLWTGPVDDSGYPIVNLYGFHDGHQFVWWLAYGPVADELWVLHTCDVRRCVRPNHLYRGDHEANTLDTVIRRRHPIGPERNNRRKWSGFKGVTPPPVVVQTPRADMLGDRNPQAKLTWDAVREIRRLYATGAFTQRELALRFGVCQVTVSGIVLGRRWPEAQSA